jgi:hypothetical protein
MNTQIFVNYTGSDIKIYSPYKSETISSLGVALVNEISTFKSYVSHSFKKYEVREIKYDQIVGLPPYVEGTKVIVSPLVMSANEKLENPRNDLVRPDTGRTCKRSGNIIEYITGFIESNITSNENNNSIQSVNENTEIINLTPHIIRLRTSDPSLDHDFESKGNARVEEHSEDVSNHNGHIIRRVIYGDIIGLPEENENVKYIVSWFVINANNFSKNPRKDLIRPDSGLSCTKDERGFVYSVTGFTI